MSGKDAKAKKGRDVSRLMQPRTDAYMAAATAPPAEPAGAAETPAVMMPLADVRPSPFQPAGRPSTETVEQVEVVARAAGGLAHLMDDAGRALLNRLGREAYDLAVLAADVEANGVEIPLEARRTATGLELLSGHRRLAAARLARLEQVPVRDVGALEDHDAAVVVFRRNRLRADFTAWQEAVSLAQLQERRREVGMSDGVRALARVMGYSVGRASELLGIARAFPPDVLTSLGGGSRAVAEGALARVPYRMLRTLLSVADADARLAAARRLARLPLAAGDAVGEAPARAAFEWADRRGGGFTLTVMQPVERMPAADAAALLGVLDAQANRLRARIESGGGTSRGAARPAPSAPAVCAGGVEDEPSAAPRSRQDASARRGEPAPVPRSRAQ